ncbi:MAG TPA: hypothetical protein VFG78_11455 [Gemmatimonadota bacterium]|nr:hypothetical protein [Gemmatimonadota bacterium]
MSDADRTPPEPPTTPPPGPPPSDATPPPRGGMSTGTKIAIGCGIVAILAIVALIVAGVAGGLFLKRKADQFTGGVEAQTEASETLQELEADHPFTPPADGLIGADRADRFFEVTDDAWQDMEEVAEDLSERGRDIEARGGEAGMRDAMAGLQGLGRARVALADALEENGMPASEYLWTGLALMRAYEELDRPAGESGIPQENLDLAAEHRAELAEIEETEEDEIGKGMVLGIAVTWGMTEGNVEALGIDTLMR